MEDRIKQMQDAINHCRELNNRIMKPDPMRRGQMVQTGTREPGDAGYLPPVKEFAVLGFSHGTVVMPLDEFEKLPKYKKNKLMRK